MTDEIVRETADRLRATSHMKQKAAIAGLIHTPVTEDGLEKSCENCIYFLARRSWCDLPELNIPVDPDWYCVLWKM
jgi:hypothetical protein